MRHPHLHRFTSLALVLTMSLSLIFAAGCGAAPEEPEAPAPDIVEPVEPEQPAEPEVPEEPETPEMPELPTPEPEAPPAEPEAPAKPAPPAPKPAKSTRPYSITVNCQTNTVTIYEKDENGEYTVPIKAMVCSSGVEGHPTPLGTYRPTGNRWTWLRMVGHVWGMYVTQIKGDYLFHSVPYLEKGNHGSLQPGEFDKLGSDASHGCIRLQVKDAKWIYDNMNNIQSIILFNSPDAGPLPKPSAPTIGDSAYPGWDPSDPVDDNPWNSAPAPTEPAEPEEIAPENIPPVEVAPEVVDPEIVDPELVAPETIAPEIVDPELVAPETIAPGDSNFEIIEPEEVPAP